MNNMSTMPQRHGRWSDVVQLYSKPIITYVQVIIEGKNWRLVGEVSHLLLNLTQNESDKKDKSFCDKKDKFFSK